jgi:ribosomal protein S18 acetylase RimI-like enzyme
MENVEITELKKDQHDLAFELSSLAREIWTQHYTPIIGLAQVEYMIKKFQSAEKILNDIEEGGYTYLLADDNGKLVGYCAFKTEYEARGVFLSKLYIQKGSRGRGISKLFIEKLLTHAKENKLDYIWLTVNKYNHTSIDIYKKLGFKIEAELVTDIGSGYVMDDYKMRLDISSSCS